MTLKTSLLASALLLSLAGLQGCAADTTSGDDDVESSDDSVTRAECRGNVGETDARCRLEGIVEKVFVGEIDPVVVGDACVAFVKVGTKRYGLVQDAAKCGDADRFAGGTVKVSFSKGALDLASRTRSKVLKAHDADATYYEFNGTLRESTDAPTDTSLAAFDALDNRAKVRFLYEISSGGDWAYLRDGFTETPIRIVDTQTGTAKDRALAEYREIADWAYRNGGDQPAVNAVQKDGVTYAYSIASSGRSYGNWASLAVYDRAWNELARFAYAD